ncbi:hypothetical protein RhiirA1_445726 [Rhizophagus irregularis]|uniref:Uncharacterized protein n=1 Tax=Rhizophagus irregularis TaxID=588596 RepID=A0A2N0R5S9_9GLOM|nr:hypothetical protein RhiirA1_445726 [Rhizophagus irregularis]
MSKHISSKLFTSKIHQFKNLPEPRNATEAFHSKSYDCFNIPDNIEDFNNSSNQNYAGTSKASSILKDDSEELSKSFNELQLNSNNGNQINYGKEIVEQQQIKQYNLNINDEDETYDDKNFHSEDDDVFEIPDGNPIVELMLERNNHNAGRNYIRSRDIVVNDHGIFDMNSVFENNFNI